MFCVLWYGITNNFKRDSSRLSLVEYVCVAVVVRLWLRQMRTRRSAAPHKLGIGQHRQGRWTCVCPANETPPMFDGRFWIEMENGHNLPNALRSHARYYLPFVQERSCFPNRSFANPNGLGSIQPLRGDVGENYVRKTTKQIHAEPSAELRG